MHFYKNVTYYMFREWNRILPHLQRPSADSVIDWRFLIEFVPWNRGMIYHEFIAQVDIFLSGVQILIFLEKLERDIDLILFAIEYSANLYCIKIFSASGHVR